MFMVVRQFDPWLLQGLVMREWGDPVQRPFSTAMWGWGDAGTGSILVKRSLAKKAKRLKAGIAAAPPMS